MTKFFILLWILLKSTFTSFAGLASLPSIRQDLVEDRKWLTDDELDRLVDCRKIQGGWPRHGQAEVGDVDRLDHIADGRGRGVDDQQVASAPTASIPDALEPACAGFN